MNEVGENTSKHFVNTEGGWKMLEIWPPNLDTERVEMMLKVSPRSENFQVINIDEIKGSFKTGQMITEQQLKDYVKSTKNSTNERYQY